MSLEGYTAGQRYAWAVYLAEMLLHNTALQGAFGGFGPCVIDGSWWSVPSEQLTAPHVSHPNTPTPTQKTALTLPTQPLHLTLEAWATINRALCLNPRPRLHAWGLAGAGMGDDGLAALLPAWSRIFATQVKVQVNE